MAQLAINLIMVKGELMGTERILQCIHILLVITLSINSKALDIKEVGHRQGLQLQANI
jgi:hypothetical protein